MNPSTYEHPITLDREILHSLGYRPIEGGYKHPDDDLWIRKLELLDSGKPADFCYLEEPATGRGFIILGPYADWEAQLERWNIIKEGA